MKSERRHDLETNELAVQVQDWLDRLKPYASQIALVLVGLLVVAYIASEWGGATSSTDQAAWDEYTLASYSTDPDLNSMKLLADNEEFASTPVPEWAYLAWSDRQVLRASQMYLVARDEAMKRLEQVQPIYENLAEGAGNTHVQDRAHFGLAQVYELQGKIDEARAKYAEVKGDLSALAESRAERLESPTVKETCDWLVKAELPKQAVPNALGSATGNRPAFEADIPAPMPNTPITDTRSLEEILTGETGASTDENRYGEGEDETETVVETEETVEDEAAPTEESADPPTDKAIEVEASETDAEKIENSPAKDAAGQ
jgi:hypothetical protein